MENSSFSVGEILWWFFWLLRWVRMWLFFIFCIVDVM